MRPSPSVAPGRLNRVIVLTLGAVVVCLVGTVAIALTPTLLFGVHAPSLHLILDSVDASIATLVAFLLLGRFRRDHSWRSLLLTAALVLLAVAPLAGGTMHAVEETRVAVWWPQALRVEGALLVAAGALVGRRVVSTRGSRTAVAALVAAAVVSGLVLWSMRAQLPVAVTASPASAATPNVTGHPVLLLAHASGAVLFLVAAVVLIWEGWRADEAEHPEDLVRWLAPACVLGAFSRVHYTLFPSIYSGWLYTGDLLRTGFYVLLLLGAAREIGQYWAGQQDLAVRADRRRVARDLHDGVVQELGFIAAEARRLEDATRRDRISEAAHRGLDEARAAVEALDHGEDETFDLQLHRLARQLTDRYGVRVVVDLDVSVPVRHDEAQALLRIAGEAAGNAARHGGASSIGIGLVRDPGGRRLVVHDDGSGFVSHAISGRGYGLTSMRDRARGLQGDLDLRSAPGRGTTVTVTW